MRAEIDLVEIKNTLQERCEALCRELLPKGRREGAHFVAHNPITNDHDHLPALKVSLGNNPAIGAWIDFRSGDKGDIFGLIAYVNGHDVKDVRFARAWALDWLGLRAMGVAERRKMAARAKQAAKKADQARARDRIKRLEVARRLFDHAQPFDVATPAKSHALAYLAARGLTLDGFNLDPATFRFSPATEYWRLAEWETKGGYPRKIKAGPCFPAIHTAMRAPTGQLVACHVTFLDPLLPQKAALPGGNPAKLVRGEAKGAVIRLNHGQSNLAPEEDFAPAILNACEGIETGLTICQALPDVRCWAAGSLSNFANMPIDMACVSSLILWRDNNIGNRQARRQFEKAVERLEDHNKPISVNAPPAHGGVDDYNDVEMKDIK